MTPTPNCAVPAIEPPEQPAVQQPDPVLAAAVEVARAAAAQEAGDEPVGAHVGVQPENGGAATHLFEANLPGYGGWRWAVTVASTGLGAPVTVSEVVLLPGPDALVAPEWVPWQHRVRPGDLGVGDLMPTEPDDPRVVPAYLQSDDPAVEEVATDLGLGRLRVLSREGRLEASDRWSGGDFGPRSEMARSAPDHCGRCAFYLSLAGSLRAAFGVCGNELSPADGRVVHVEYGCGAHSEVELEAASPVPVADLVYDDTTLDYLPRERGTAQPDVPAPADEAPAGALAEPVADVLSDAPVDEAEAPVADAVEQAEPVDALAEPVEPEPGPVSDEGGPVEQAGPSSETRSRP